MERSLFKSVCFCAAGVWPVGGNQQWEYSGNDPQSGCGADPQRGKSHPPRPSEGKRIRARLRWAVPPVRSDSPVWLPLSLALSSFLSHSAVGLLWWFLTTKLCQSLVLTHTTKAAREKPGSEFKNLISKAASHQNPLVCADILTESGGGLCICSKTFNNIILWPLYIRNLNARLRSLHKPL